VRRAAVIVPLAELLEQHRRGRPTGGAVAISFDDAYASLLDAAPVFRSESIPLTVFVTTNAAATGAAYWWDRIDDLFPRVERQRWIRFEDELGLPPAFRSGQPADFGPLRPLRQWMLAEFKGRWHGLLEAPLAALEHETGVRTRHRSMTFEELHRFAAEPLVDFGVHTLTHPVLPLLDDAEFSQEVAECFSLLRTRLPRVHPVLAIPFGLFDGRTATLARECGMSSSLSLAARTLGRFQPEQSLPRFGLTVRESGWKLVLRVTGAAESLLGSRMGGGESYPALPSATT
jgi:peptidoglycan/xylan/chitin deacetylase (PgdA/CDA1 family)